MSFEVADFSTKQPQVFSGVTEIPVFTPSYIDFPRAFASPPSVVVTAVNFGTTAPVLGIRPYATTITNTSVGIGYDMAPGVPPPTVTGPRVYLAYQACGIPV